MPLYNNYVDLVSAQTVGGAKTFTSDVTSTGLTLTNTSSIIGVNTTDGADNKSLGIVAGSANSPIRGAGITLAGNEHASTGLAQLSAGNVAGAKAQIVTVGASQPIELYTQNVLRWTADDGAFFPNSTYDLGKTAKPIGTTYTNNIVGPTYTAWTPTLTASGGMTVTAGTLTARYMQIGKLVMFTIGGTVNTATAAGIRINMTLPVTAATLLAFGGGGYVLDGADIPIFWYASTTTSIDMKKFDSSNFTSPGTVTFRFSGSYEAA